MTETQPTEWDRFIEGLRTSNDKAARERYLEIMAPVIERWRASGDWMPEIWKGLL